MLGELLLERVVAGGVVEVHGVVLDAATKGASLGSDSSTPPPLMMPSFMSAAKVCSSGRRATPTTAKSFGQKPGLLQVIERGQQLALGEIAGGAEDDDDARVRRALGLLGGGCWACFADQGFHRSLLLN